MSSSESLLEMSLRPNARSRWLDQRGQLDWEESPRTRWSPPKFLCNLAARIFPHKFGRMVKLAVLVFFLLAGAVIHEIIFTTSTSDPYDIKFARFLRQRLSPHDSATYPVEFFGSVMPVPCHSHNDYWRETPLYAALGSGCVSVEADVWLQNGELFVGHTESSLREDITLRTMYLEPLANILEVMHTPRLPGQNPMSSGVFYNDPDQALTLLIDFKAPSPEAWPVLLELLQPLRDAGWLTHWNGTARIERQITIVASGSIDFEILVSNHTYRDVFYDAPLDKLEDHSDWILESDVIPEPDSNTDEAVWRFKYNPSNSHYASAKLSNAVGPVLSSRLSVQQLDMMSRQIRNARERHLIPRYFGTPRWPRGLRDTIWALLLQEGVGMLNVDDLRAARKGTWGIWP